MPDLINYVATSGGHICFGMAEDPAAEIAEMQAGTPQPVELVAGWIMPPKGRLPLLARLQRALRGKPRSGQWFDVPVDWATKTLRAAAKELGGRRWEVRKRPHPSERVLPGHARAVVTPHGRYPSAKAAAEALGVSRQAVWERASRRSPGWRFEDDDRPRPVRASPGRPRKELS
jgi:hypothetical protein